MNNEKATLAACYNNGKVFEGVVKIRRGKTAKIVTELNSYEEAAALDDDDDDDDDDSDGGGDDYDFDDGDYGF